jgi:antibiotic biosynthesis monooxygenase (ABM) superfamily enzyme
VAQIGLVFAFQSAHTSPIIGNLERPASRLPSTDGQGEVCLKRRASMPEKRRFPSYLSVFAFITALVLANASTGREQSQMAAPKWSVVTFVSVKPDQVSEFEAWQKELMAAYKKADVPSRDVVQTIMGDLFEYISIYPVSHFADLDGPTPVEHALGKEEADKLMQKGRAYIQSAHRIASIGRDDLSLNAQRASAAPYALVIIVQLMPGKTSNFEAWLKNQYLPVLKKADVKNFWTSRTVFGGDPDETVMVTPLDKMAAIDAGPPAERVLGKEGAQKLFGEVQSYTRSVQYRMVRYRADLSYDMTAEHAKASASSK